MTKATDDVPPRHTVGLCVVCLRPGCERTDCHWVPWPGQEVDFATALADMRRLPEARYVDSEHACVDGADAWRESSYAWRAGKLWYWAGSEKPLPDENGDERNAALRWTRVDLPARQGGAGGGSAGGFPYGTDNPATTGHRRGAEPGDDRGHAPPRPANPR